MATIKHNGHIGNDTLVVNAGGTRVNIIKDPTKSNAAQWLWLDLRRTPLWIYNGHTASITVGLKGEKVKNSTKYPKFQYSYDNSTWTTIASSTSAPSFSLGAGKLAFIRTNINWSSVSANNQNIYGQYLSLYSSRNASNIVIGGNIMSIRGTTSFSNATANTVSTTDLIMGTLYHVNNCNLSHLLIANTNCESIFARPHYINMTSGEDRSYGTNVSPIFYVSSSTHNLSICFNKYPGSTNKPNILQVLATGTVTPTFSTLYAGPNCAPTSTLYYSNNITWTTATDTTGAGNKGIPKQWTMKALNKTYTTKL
jgi:hypothetical protein